MNELILNKPIDEIIPAMISWNNKELLAEVKESLKKYDGKIYDENTILEAKADRAKLNNFSKSLDSARLDIKRQYIAPLDKFTAEVNEVISEVKTVGDGIDKQIKDYETQKQKEKQEIITAYFLDKIGELGDFIKYEQIHSPKWLNATASIKSINAEIDAKIEQINNELSTIAALKSDDENTLKAYYFRSLNLSSALMENERIKAAKQRIAEAKARAEAAAAVTSEKPKETPVEVVKQSSEPVTKEPEIFTIRFEVEGTKTQFIALKAFLNTTDMKYKSI